jgi:hypothetical protein
MNRDDEFQKASVASFSAVHLLWYAGALVVVAALCLFSTVAGVIMGGSTVVMIEVAVIVVAAIALRFIPLPFILLIGAVALWFLAMDVLRRFGVETIGDWESRRRITLGFGLVTVAAAWALDLSRARRDFGFWLHLVGATTLWCALAASESTIGFGKGVFYLFNVGFIALGLFLNRSVYVVLGALGLVGSLVYLAADALGGRLPLVLALAALVVAIIVLGVVFQRRQGQINAAIERHIPAMLRALRPARAFAS